MRTLVLDRHSITRLSVASLHLREAISVNGRRRRSGQRNSSKRTRCIACSQRRNPQRLLSAVNGQRLALLPPRRQAIYKQRRAPHTRIQVMKLCLKGRLAVTWTNTSQASRRQARDTKQIILKDTIFRDDIFDVTCERLRGKNEARIFKDCTPLIVP